MNGGGVNENDIDMLLLQMATVKNSVFVLIY